MRLYRAVLACVAAASCFNDVIEPPPPDVLPRVGASIFIADDVALRYDVIVQMDPGTDGAGYDNVLSDPTVVVEDSAVTGQRLFTRREIEWLWRDTESTTPRDSLVLRFPGVQRYPFAGRTVRLPVASRAGPRVFDQAAGQDFDLVVQGVGDSLPGYAANGPRNWSLDVGNNREKRLSVSGTGARNTYRVPASLMQLVAGDSLFARLQLIESYRSLSAPFPHFLFVQTRIAWSIRVVP